MRIFLFSSRRRHTRYIGDWSSDVCSSDLQVCVTLDPTQAATCLALCDVECGNANPPARCTGEANATCPGGKKIGRASCRERAEMSRGEGGGKKKRVSERRIQERQSRRA